MKRQIAKVDEDLAHGAIMHGFILKALSLTCPDARVCVAACSLQSVLMDRLLEKYQKAVDKMEFLLFVERCDAESLSLSE